MVIVFDVTRHALSLGNADSTTGWYAPLYNESTIQMIIRDQGASIWQGSIGLHAIYPHTGFTDDSIAEGDLITDSLGKIFLVQTVEPITIGDSLYCYRCKLDYSTLYADRPTTSGTWPSVSDPSSRVKVWLDTYLTAANMKEDDNTTNALTFTAFGFPDYPLYRVFINKGVDLIFSIGPSNGEPLIQYDKTAYANAEHTPITVCCINKSGLTARRLLWAGVQEIRRIGIAQPLGTGSVRVVASDKPTTENLGSTILYSVDVTVDWTRDTT